MASMDAPGHNSGDSNMNGHTIRDRTSPTQRDRSTEVNLLRSRRRVQSQFIPARPVALSEICPLWR